VIVYDYNTIVIRLRFCRSTLPIRRSLLHTALGTPVKSSATTHVYKQCMCYL